MDRLRVWRLRARHGRGIAHGHGGRFTAARSRRASPTTPGRSGRATRTRPTTSNLRRRVGPGGTDRGLHRGIVLGPDRLGERWRRRRLRDDRIPNLRGAAQEGVWHHASPRPRQRCRLPSGASRAASTKRSTTTSSAVSACQKARARARRNRRTGTPTIPGMLGHRNVG